MADEMPLFLLLILPLMLRKEATGHPKVVLTDLLALATRAAVNLMQGAERN